MALEIVGALLIGLLVLWLVFEPALFPGRSTRRVPEPEAPEETRRGIALLSLKEIEFDRATGKLSEGDYETLRTRYAGEAIAALAADQAGPNGAAGTGDPEALIAARLHQLRSARTAGQPAPPSCSSCGPRPEPDARFCSACGLPLGTVSFCSSCGTALDVDNRFCTSCGSRVAA
jgi:double zinc ribbon protein